MKYYSRYFFTLLIVSLMSLNSGVINAQERIISFHSDIDINIDASMTVTETIVVQAEGINIRRGIFRDFPTRYNDQYGNAYVVDFDVLDVFRDGSKEPWRQQRQGNGVRVYIGDANTVLAPEEYTYEIRYRTNRQLGFFEDHDELYWNVTGNGWAFSILNASATVHLPASVPADQITMEAYTGLQSSRGRSFEALVTDGGASVESTVVLGPQAGLTLVMTWPKGIVSEPGALQQSIYLLSDNLGVLLALLTLICATAYLYKTWLRVGIDPTAGIIFPHYAPPKGYSPASTRYISRMSYDKKTLTAAIINLAVNGHLKITMADGDYTLNRAELNEAPLAAGEKALLSYLFIDSDELELDNKNSSIISKASSMHKKALRRDYLNIYFARNTWLLLPSAAGSVATIVIVALSNSFVPIAAFLYIVNVLLHLIFIYLMKAPSRKGRLLMDKLDGFKLYLEVAEQDDLNLRNPPDKTPELFESYLPFAVALGVEQAWAEQFTAVFASIEARNGVSYHPVWYYGHFNSTQLSDFTKDVSSSMNTAISTASTPPGSTSGAGGGGFSGGGGGGGGGGGW